MYKLALATEQERGYVFLNCAAKMGIHVALIEKDFWVCLLLDYLFHRNEIGKHIAFKGGTCLSKVYNVISRFSEDIDLILDWRLLGYEAKEPWAERSKSKQLKFNEEANQRTIKFLQDVLIPTMRTDFQKLLAREIQIEIDAVDNQTVNFYYPAVSNDRSILRSIRLEIGTLAAWSPFCYRPISPLVAGAYPQLLASSSTIVRATSIERSFWEKATILHQEAHRPENSRVPARYSRHYYDLYRLACSDYKTSAFNQASLLQTVATFKDKFYPRSWARYDLAAHPETLMLFPGKHVEVDLRNDYEAMQEMLYGIRPSFDEILISIQNLENEIHTLKQGNT